MRKIRKSEIHLVALFTIAVFLLVATPVLAAGFGISPPSVEFDVPANGNTQMEFLVYNFTGDLQISLEDIPLRVEPEIVPVDVGEEGCKVLLTFYGDESLGSQVFNGKIRFLALTSGNVAVGIKVKATINHIVAGQPLPQTTPQESLTPLVGGIIAGVVAIGLAIFFWIRKRPIG